MTNAPATTQQHAVDWLRAAIVSGALRPGARIPQEDVAERIGVSLIPVREALRVLESEGQVTYFPRRGYFVTELRVEDLIEIFALRELLESRAARAAAERLDDELVARMAQAAADCTAAGERGDVAAELAANRSLHLGLFEAAGEPHTMRLIRQLWEATEAYRALYYNEPVHRRDADEAHARIVSAAARRDAAALVAEARRSSLGGAREPPGHPAHVGLDVIGFAMNESQIAARHATPGRVSTSPFGPDDEIGMLNLITADSRAAVMAEAEPAASSTSPSSTSSACRASPCSAIRRFRSGFPIRRAAPSSTTRSGWGASTTSA